MSLVANGDCSRTETHVARIPVRLPACFFSFHLAAPDSRFLGCGSCRLVSSGSMSVSDCHNRVSSVVAPIVDEDSTELKARFSSRVASKRLPSFPPASVLQSNDSAAKCPGRLYSVFVW